MLPTSYKMAAEGFEWCVAAAEELATENSTNQEPDNKYTMWLYQCNGVVLVLYSSLALLGMCLTDKGQFHLIVGNGKAALDCFRRGLSVAKEVFGEDHIQVVMQTV